MVVYHKDPNRRLQQSASGSWLFQYVSDWPMIQVEVDGKILDPSTLTEVACARRSTDSYVLKKDGEKVTGPVRVHRVTPNNCGRCIKAMQRGDWENDLSYYSVVAGDIAMLSDEAALTYADARDELQDSL